MIEYPYTKNGTGDLAVMSIEAHEQTDGEHEFYELLDEGLEDMRLGRGKPAEEVFAELRAKYQYNGI